MIREHGQPNDEMSEWTALYAVGALSTADHVAFEAHLRGGCRSCQAELSAFEAIVGKLAFTSQPASPPSSLLQRLLDRIETAQPSTGTDLSASAAQPSRSAIAFQENGLLISRSADISWQPTDVQGVWSKPLFIDPVRKYSTALIRMEAGTVYPAHQHNDVEELYMLAGDLLVEGYSMGPGDYCRAEALTTHSEISTELGALFFTLSSQRDQRLDQAPGG